jgi:hypothetical protein
LVKSKKNVQVISMKELPAGKYFLQAETSNGVVNRAVVKE